MVDLRRQVELNAAIELLHFAYRALIAKPDRMLAARGLSRVHHRILYFVARLPRPSVNELLRVLGVSKQALNRPLRELYAQKLIRFERASEDARIRRLELTAAGKRLEGKLSALQRQRFTAAFAASGANAEAGWREVMLRFALPEIERARRRLPDG
jgi:DNA-binding MarR family transcriptional regulator